MFLFKHLKKQHFSAQVADKRLQISQVLLSRNQDGMLPNLVYSDEKKFDVEHHFNTQNDWVRPRDWDEGSRVVTRKQYAATVMVWAAVTDFGRSALFFVDQGVKLNQQNYQNDILVALGTEAIQKTSLVFFLRTLHHHMGPKRLRCDFPRMSPTSFPKRNGPIFPRSESS